MKTGAVICAAGHSSSANVFNPLLSIGHTTVIRKIIMTLKQCGVDPIVVITGRDAKEVEKHISKLRVICLRNEEYENSQMFDSIGMGLRYIEDLCDRILILPPKFPLLVPETIKKIMECSGRASCPVYEGRRGHPVMIHKNLIPALLSYRGERGLRGALRQEGIDALVEEIPVDDKGIIEAVETDQDTAIYPTLQHQVMHPSVRLSLEFDEVFFGPEMAQFLMLIEHAGSMQTACRQMNMSYSKGFKLLKNAESLLGYPLLITQSGGLEGGFSQLTPKAVYLMEKYMALEKELKGKAEELFKKYFEEGS
nr:NTP transferase domain-containing protein [uncultured Clostridium sp.]